MGRFEKMQCEKETLRANCRIKPCVSRFPFSLKSEYYHVNDPILELELEYSHVNNQIMEFELEYSRVNIQISYLHFRSPVVPSGVPSRFPEPPPGRGRAELQQR